MAFCGKCGTQAEAGVKFCPNCGAEMMAPQQPEQPAQNDFVAKLQNLNNTADTTADFTPQDISQNKVMAVLAYLGILWLIPYFGAKQSPYAQYHCKQGLTLMLIDIAYVIVNSVLSAVIKVPEYVYGIYVGSYTPGWLTAILWLIGIPIAVLAIIGIINAATGKAKELPVLGKLRLLK